MSGARRAPFSFPPAVIAGNRYRPMSKTDEHAGADAHQNADWADQVSVNPNWDQDVADDLIGAIVLVGITDAGQGEDAVEQLEMWGMVESADPEAGIEIELHGELAGESFICPPDLEAFWPAEPGIYTLDSTGERIADPDFMTSWTAVPAERDRGHG